MELARPVTNADHALLSDNRKTSAACHINKEPAMVSVFNRGMEPWINKKGQALDTWTHDQWYDPKTPDIPGDMLEIRRAQLPFEEDKTRKLINPQTKLSF